MSNVQKTQTNAVSTEVNFGDLGDYQAPVMDRADVKIPYIVLIQKMTDIDELKGIENKPGQLVAMSTKTVADSFDVVVVDMFKTARMFKRQLNSDGKFNKEKDSDGRDIVLKYSSNGKTWDEDGTPIVDDWSNPEHGFISYNYLVIRKGEEFPELIVFKGAGANKAKDINYGLQRMRPSWRRYLTIASTQERNGNNNYFVLSAKFGDNVDQTTADIASGYYRSMKNVTINTSDTNDFPDFD